MGNINKHLKNNARRGLCMAQGGVLSDLFQGVDDVNSTNPLVGSKRYGDGNPLPPMTTGLRRSVDQKVLQNDMVSGLSNTDRYQLSNPSNQPYKATGVSPGSAAEASMLDNRSNILNSMRDNLPLDMAQGGVIDDDIDPEMAARIAASQAKFNPPKKQGFMARLFGSTPTPSVQKEQPAPPVQKEQSAPMAVIDTIKKRQAAIDAAAGMQRGGIVRDGAASEHLADDVPVNLTRNEAVLPPNTVRALGGARAVEALIETTNGKPPVRGIKAGGRYAGGFVPTEDALAAERLAKGAMVAQLGPQPFDARSVVLGDQGRGVPVGHNPQPPVTRPLSHSAPLSGERLSNDDVVARDTYGQLVGGAVPRGLRSGDTLRYGPSAVVDSKENLASSARVPTASGMGVASMRQNDGTYRNVLLGKQTGPAWEDGAAYKAALARNEADKQTLADMQRERIKRTAVMPGATAGDRLALALQLRDDEARAANGAGLANAQRQMFQQQFDLAKFQHDLDKAKKSQSNADRDAAFREDKDHQDRVDKLLQNWASVDGKLDNQRYTALQKYAGQFARGKGMSSDEHLSSLMDNLAVDSLFEEQGRHWSTPEKPSGGEVVLPKRGEAGGLAWLQGRSPWQQSYVDPLTSREIYESDVARNLTPTQRAILDKRIALTNKLASKG